jgi:hypothetical protein
MNEPEELHLEVGAGRSGRGPATWGQKAIWDAVTALGDEGTRYTCRSASPSPAAVRVPRCWRR